MYIAGWLFSSAVMASPLEWLSFLNLCGVWNKSAGEMAADYVELYPYSGHEHFSALSGLYAPTTEPKPHRGYPAQRALPAMLTHGR